MVSPSGLCGVGERDRFRRMGEQAGVLRFELLAVLQGQMERGSRVEREGRRRKDRQSVTEGQRWVPRSQLREPGSGAGEKQGEKGLAMNSLHRNTAVGQEGAVVPV